MHGFEGTVSKGNICWLLLLLLLLLDYILSKVPNVMSVLLSKHLRLTVTYVKQNSFSVQFYDLPLLTCTSEVSGSNTDLVTDLPFIVVFLRLSRRIPE